MVDGNKKMTPAQILEAAEEEGYELTDEELDGVAGGGEWRNECCPQCGHTGTMYCPGTGVSRCGKCGNTWQRNENAAWAGECSRYAICFNIGDRKTNANIVKKGAFTVASTDAAHAVESDYFGIAAGNKVDKSSAPGVRA